MLQSRYSINWISFLLSWVAGFCDTATYVGGDGIFSAHVTGNFIVFAAQAVLGTSGPHNWIKLLTFPVFVLSIVIGSWLAENTNKKYILLLAEGVLLMICGLAITTYSMFARSSGEIASLVIVMTTVFALGLQNTFGKLHAKETHGPTTMMTGNVTQAALDISQFMRRGVSSQNNWRVSFQKHFFIIGGFLIGCVAGALFAGMLGLPALILPGVALVVCYLLGDTISCDNKNG